MSSLNIKQSYENDLKKDVLKYFPVKILPAISGLLTVYLLTRTISTSLYSNYAFITATILLFGQLVSGWINSSIIYFYTDYDNLNELDSLKINLIVLQLVLFLIGAIGFAFTSYFGLRDFIMVIFGLLLLLSQIVLNLLYSFLQVERKILQQIRTTFLQSLIQITGIVFCYYFHKENLYFVIGVIFLSYFIASNYVMYTDKIYSLFFNRKVISYLNFRLAKKVLVYGLPICVWFFASQLYVIGDRILFQYFNVKNLVANYVSFRDLSVGLSGFITMPLLLASHPIIMQMSKNNVSKEQIEIILSRNIKLLITLFTSVFTGIFLIGDNTLIFIVGEKYLLDNNMMFLVLLTILFGAISMYLHKGLEVTGKTILMAKIALTVALLSFSFNFLLLPLYGVKAACVIALAAQLVYSLIVYKYSKHVFRVEISYNFIFMNFFIVFLAFVFTNFVFEKKLFLFSRFIVFLILTSYLLITSKEIKIMINKNKN
jgi:O-antigen/teichoic acid export membrane protein